MGFRLGCPECKGWTSEIYRAYEEGEDCPYCGANLITDDNAKHYSDQQNDGRPSQWRWGEPYEQDGWTFYARKVAVDPTKTVVVVNGRKYFALQVDKAVEERGRKTAEAVRARLDKLKKDADGS